MKNRAPSPRTSNGVAAAFLLLVLLALPAPACPATFYISPGGSNWNGGKSLSSPWKSFAKAFSSMAAGDELVLLDGTYSEKAGTGVISWEGSASGQPPSGAGRRRMTVVRALNEGKAVVSTGADGKGPNALAIGRKHRKDSYIRIQGIRFDGGGGLYNTSWVHVKNCGFWSTREDGGGVFGIGTNDHSQGNFQDLVEDCWVWGRNRIIAANYMADNNVWRRVVVRGDGCSSPRCTGSGNPNVGFTVYNSRNVSVQNVVVLDRVLDGGTLYGNFASAQHSPGPSLGPVEWLGCISLNSPDEGYYLEADEAVPNAVRIENCVAWDSGYDGFNLRIPSSGLVFENNTAGRSRKGTGIGISKSSSGTVRNLVSHDSAADGISSCLQPSYTNVSLAGRSPYHQTTPTVGVRGTNPRKDGRTPSLKHIVRIEAGSALKGAGFDGADYGANVVKRYGEEGSFWGEAGSRSLSAADLWPWPNEARIRGEMGAASARGFCAPGSNPSTGNPVTLTGYVWEYLGAPYPGVRGGKGSASP